MKQKNWGRIVVIRSEAQSTVPAGMIHYGNDKTAQLPSHVVSLRPMPHRRDV